MSQDLSIQQHNALATQAGGARMEVAVIRERLRAVEQIMRDVMIPGVHYGTIPGCGKKPTLLKPGAEMLAMMFRLAPTIDVSIAELGGGHREYTVKCSMVHIPTGEVWAQGIGSCSTMESKYRYRGTEAEDTGKPVPKAYWDAKNAGDMKKAAQLLGGSEFAAKKSESGGYTIHKKGLGKAENPDIADVYNTCLKMGKKRGQTDSTLSALGCSHVFTQDLEDLRPMDYDSFQPPDDASPQQATQAMQNAQAQVPGAISDEEDLEAFAQAIEDQILVRPKGVAAVNALLEVLKIKSVREVKRSERRDFFNTVDMKSR